MNTRTVAVVTGTRAEYGLLHSPMEKIRDHPALELVTVATGMHLSPQYGLTVSEIEADGFGVDRKVDMLIDADTGLSMAKSLGIGTMGHAEAFRDIGPDIVLVLGDRDEPLAAALAAAHMNIPVAHIHGGDVMVGAIIDDSIRYALTKFSHIHFPVSDQSAERVANLGEEKWRIMVSGAPGLDKILEGEYVPGDQVRKELGLDPDRAVALVVQHPVTTMPEEAGEQMRVTLDVVADQKVQPVVIYPNSDAGGKQMIDEIESHPARDSFTVFKNLTRSKYLGLMETADVMVGNSSSGVIESSSLDAPVVDIGPREKRRQRAENTISAPHEETEIRKAVERCLTDEAFIEQVNQSENPYDYGGAGEIIADRLASIELGDRVMRKNITF